MPEPVTLAPNPDTDHAVQVAAAARAARREGAERGWDAAADHAGSYDPDLALILRNANPYRPEPEAAEGSADR